MKIKLFSTPICHLCSRAKAIIAAYMAGNSGITVVEIELEVVDIINDAELLALYGESIPVVREVTTGAELYWPFDDERFALWISELQA